MEFPRLQIPKIDLRSIEWPSFDISGIRWSKMPNLKIGNSVARLPIVQGGMGVGISLSGLASAVAKEGGIGVIAANSIGILDPGYYATHKDANLIALRKEIRKAKGKTSGIIGVNIMFAVHDFQELLWVCIQEKIDIVFIGAGLPIRGIPVKDLRLAQVKVVPIVSSARAAELIFRSWEKKYNDIPDAVVVEGPKAGGHLGFKAHQIDDPDFALEKIVPEVVGLVKLYEQKFSRLIPVIAAGGIFTGSDIFKYFKLGANGVQMGTRFVATHECDANIRFKEAYISCKEEDIGIIKSPVGLPGRAIVNRFLKEASSGLKKKIKCNWKCLKNCNVKSASYCISQALDQARKGELHNGFAFAGSNAFRVDKIISVKELLLELKGQYLTAEEKNAGTLKDEYLKAIEKIASLKEEYFKALKSALSSLKSDYEKNIEKSISTLRDEYLKAVDNANVLKEELIALFERYSLFHRLNAVEI